MPNTSRPASATPRAAFARYLPVDPDALDWGLHVLDAGFTDIPPHSPYPPGEHPDGYMFTWDRGRVLTEYQLVYILRGAGVFECRDQAQTAIGAGDLFLLFPGRWHRYRPDPDTGWDENWIGFNGAYARHLMARFFPGNRPVLRLGQDEELLRRIRSVAQLMQSAPPGYQQMVAGETTAVLARVRALAMREHGPTSYHERRMHQACCYLLEHAAEDVSIEELAESLGYSYSRFRSVFKAQTGMPPRQYQLEIRINRAKDLLRESDQSMSEIADRLGFCSVYYFSRLFKQKTGVPPSLYRTRSVNGSMADSS